VGILGRRSGENLFISRKFQLKSAEGNEEERQKPKLSNSKTCATWLGHAQNEEITLINNLSRN
jgi:hypothetical protein